MFPNTVVRLPMFALLGSRHPHVETLITSFRQKRLWLIDIATPQQESKTYVLVTEVHEHCHLIHKLHLRTHGRLQDGLDCNRDRSVHDAFVHLHAPCMTSARHATILTSNRALGWPILTVHVSAKKMCGIMKACAHWCAQSLPLPKVAPCSPRLPLIRKHRG